MTDARNTISAFINGTISLGNLHATLHAVSWVCDTDPMNREARRIIAEATSAGWEDDVIKESLRELLK